MDSYYYCCFYIVVGMILIVIFNTPDRVVQFRDLQSKFTIWEAKNIEQFQ
jgi:hypothetical protein